MSNGNKGAIQTKSYLFTNSFFVQISIQLVQYGRLTPNDDTCLPNIRYPKETLEENKKCLILEAIRDVEERCHSKRYCSFMASPENLASNLKDPCPKVR